MKNNPAAIALIIAVGVLLIALAVWRTLSASAGVIAWVALGLPVLMIGFGLMALAAWLRRRKTAATWQFMIQNDRTGEHFIVFVYPATKSQLVRLGWKLHGSAYASIPAIGMSIDDSAIRFWEAGIARPSLVLNTADFTSARVGSVTDGYRSHPALVLTLNQAARNQLSLNLRDERHRNAAPDRMRAALDRIVSTNA